MRKRWSSAEVYHRHNGTEFYFAAASWSPDGTCLLTADSSRTLRLFNTPPHIFANDDNHAIANTEPLEALVMKRADPIYSTSWYPQMNSQDSATCCFVLATRDHPLLLLDAYNGSVRASYTAIADGDVTTAPHSTAFHPFGTHIYGGMDGKIVIFDVNIQGTNPVSYISTTPTRKSNQGQKGLLSSLATSPTHPTLVLAGSYSKSIAIYDTTCNESVALINGLPGTGTTQAEFGVDGNSLVVANRKSNVIQVFDVRNLASGTPLFEMERNIASTNQRVSFSQSGDGRILVSGDEDGNVHVFDLADSGKLLSCTSGVSRETVGGVAVHPYYCASTLTPAAAAALPENAGCLDSSSNEMDTEKNGDTMNVSSPLQYSYWIATCSGQRRKISVYGNYSDSDSDFDDDMTQSKKQHQTGTSAEISMYQIN
ncbi:WD40-repeat-containing domain protein [Obelidium mucronatum]|nr:WD40-repeat-containing domain protein [Obelidium mucronatum]